MALPRKVDPGKAKRLAEYLVTSGLKWKSTHNSYIFDCPRCSKADKLYMFKDDGRFICFYCAEINGFKGKAEYALSELQNVPVSEVCKELYGGEAPTIEMFFDFQLEDWWSNDEIPDGIPTLDDIQVRLWGPDAIPIEAPLAKKGAEYLAGRGIDLELAKHYGIRYSGSKMRVLFPVQYQNRLFGWQGRAIGPTEFEDPETGEKKSVPKTLTVEGLKKDKVLMFADQLDGASQVIVCEGPVDAIKCHRCSPDGVQPAGNVATLGKAVSRAQIDLIRYSGAKKVYLALDPDADRETMMVIEALESYMDVHIMCVPKPYHDFGEMSLDEVAAVYRQAPKVGPSSLFLYLKPPEPAPRRRSGLPRRR